MSPYTKENPSSIQALFDNIAPRYDLANALNSLFLYKLWNRGLIKGALKKNPHNILDLCAGTGEIARGLLKPENSVTLVDLSVEMLQVAKRRLTQPNVSFIQADAEQLPCASSSFDAATCAYGVRNISNRQAAFSELFRVLKPKGSLAICELTRPDFAPFRLLHSGWLKTVVPLVGRLLTTDEAAYSYLSKSIQSFISKEMLAEELQAAGFCTIRVVPQTFGIATLFFAEKP